MFTGEKDPFQLTKSLACMKLHLTALLLLCGLPALLYAQHSPQAFGKIDKADLEMTACDFDPSAEAMVLFDAGRATCYVNLNTYIPENMVSSDLEEHVRIKIFSEKGLAKANVKIRYYSGNNVEEIKSLSAQTINLDASGNIVITKLESGQVYRNKINNRYSEVTFVFPDVKPGSIIEYKYRKTARNLAALSQWYFQYSIPAKYSSYEMDYPDVLDISVNSARCPAVIRTEQAKDMRVVKSYTLKNIPALEEEPYMTCREDYLQQLDPMVLAAIDRTTGQRFNLVKDWKQVINELLENEDFGLQLKKKIPRTSDLELQLSGLSDPFKKMNIIYQYVKKNMLWDGKNSMWALDGVKSAWRDKKGNAGEINLILVNLLKDADLDANPILVSTRDNGRIMTNVAGDWQFNKAMAYVSIGDKHYVLDATGNTPVHLIPEDVLYSEGLLIGKSGKAEDWGWKMLVNEGQKFDHDLLLIADIDEKGAIAGEATLTSKEYGRAEKTRLLKKGKDKFTDALTEANSGYSVDSLYFENETTDSLPFIQHFKYNGKVNSSGEYSYFSVNHFSGFEKNPFISDDRLSDVFFGAGQNYRMVILYNIPENYVFEGKPKDVKMIMPDTSIVFSRVSAIDNNMLSTTISVKFNSPFYAPDDYPALQEFYKKMFTYLNEQYVIKKK